tara:strand:+ start:5749 stop:6234 length:486 start_codon:yes stop_codon:yes gene_type:complete
MSQLETPSVRRVRDALMASGLEDRVIELSETARSAQDAADSIGTELGSIVKSLVFRIGDQAVMALVAGDRQCDTKALPAALGLTGKCHRADADMVREATGFAIGGVAPVGHPGLLPIAMDVSLRRFPVIYAAAGHPYCVFPTTPDDLQLITGAIMSDSISS